MGLCATVCVSLNAIGHLFSRRPAQRKSAERAAIGVMLLCLGEEKREIIQSDLASSDSS